VSVTLPDGVSKTQYTYQGNVTTVTDPAGKWKQYASDAFGNLRTVLEPDPTANPVPGAPNPPPTAYPVTTAPTGMLLTSYTYDQLSHLTQVAMPRTVTGTLVTQTRTFAYDPVKEWLTSATNPENGTVSYTYNGDGTLLSKTDAIGNKQTCAYDTYQRLSAIHRFPCQLQSFTYDSLPSANISAPECWWRPSSARYPARTPAPLAGKVLTNWASSISTAIRREARLQRRPCS
jgi:YD repeat-containing protein